jgi:hypothetical protein
MGMDEKDDDERPPSWPLMGGSGNLSIFTIELVFFILDLP